MNVKEREEFAKLMLDLDLVNGCIAHSLKAYDSGSKASAFSNLGILQEIIHRKLFDLHKDKDFADVCKEFKRLSEAEVKNQKERAGVVRNPLAQ